MSENIKQTITISTWTMVRFILVLLGFYLIYLIGDILALVFISIILTSALEPGVTFLQKKIKLPRALAVLLIYLLMLAIISLLVYLLVPPITEQVKQLVASFPAIFEQISLLGQNQIVETISHGLTQLQSTLTEATAGSFFDSIIYVFGGLISFLLILVVTFYMLIEEDATRRVVRSLAPDKYQPYVINLLYRMQHKIGQWVRAQLILTLVIGVFTYITLVILGVKYALVLAIIAGLGEFIRFIGPIIAAIPAVIIALSQSPLHALLVIALYLVIHQLEGNVLVPKVMQKTVGLNPVVVIIVLLIGAKLAGFVGAVLAIPVATSLNVFINDLIKK